MKGQSVKNKLSKDLARFQLLPQALEILDYNKSLDTVQKVILDYHNQLDSDKRHGYKDWLKMIFNDMVEEIFTAQETAPTPAELWIEELRALGSEAPDELGTTQSTTHISSCREVQKHFAMLQQVNKRSQSPGPFAKGKKSPALKEPASPGTFGKEKRILSEQQNRSPGPAAYETKEMRFREKSPRATISQAEKPNNFVRNPIIPGPSHYTPLINYLSKSPTAGRNVN